MLTLYCPDFRMPEREYAVRVVFETLLRLKYRIIPHDEDHWCLTDPEAKRCLIMPDAFFSRACENWLEPDSLPEQPLPAWNTASDLPDAVLVKPDLPVIAGQPHPDGAWFFRSDENTALLGLDVIGSAFFMLTRYEEVVKPDHDEHDRFPDYASLAYQESFLDRPIVDEYVEVLWAVMKGLWPGLERQKQEYRLVLTHDVDAPFGVKGETWCRIIRRFGRDLLRLRDPALAARHMRSLLVPGQAGDRLDPNNTFDWIMDQSECNGILSEFNFMAGNTSDYDGGYDLFAPRIQRLLRRIHDRGHIIGLHPSYGTLDRPDLLSSEADNLRQALDKAGVPQVVRSGRQHYLRWHANRTWADWEKAGLKEDSSVGFAQHAGFRAGTCKSYPVWSLINCKPIKLIENSLIIMERTLLSEQYMNLSLDAAEAFVKKMLLVVKLMKGNMVVLWHNDHFLDGAAASLYYQVLKDGVLDKFGIASSKG
jgi:hypothetical protein